MTNKTNGDYDKHSPPPASAAGHITANILEHELSADIMKHIGSCDYCAGLFADHIEQNACIEAPRDLKTNILARSRQPDVQLIARSNHLSKRLQLFYYSLKVGAAVLCALTLLSISPDMAGYIRSARLPLETGHQVIAPERTFSLYKSAEDLTKYLHRISISNPEVKHNDKKEK